MDGPVLARGECQASPGARGRSGWCVTSVSPAAPSGGAESTARSDPERWGSRPVVSRLPSRTTRSKVSETTTRAIIVGESTTVMDNGGNSKASAVATMPTRAARACGVASPSTWTMVAAYPRRGEAETVASSTGQAVGVEARLTSWRDRSRCRAAQRAPSVVRRRLARRRAGVPAALRTVGSVHAAAGKAGLRRNRAGVVDRGRMELSRRSPGSPVLTKTSTCRCGVGTSLNWSRPSTAGTTSGPPAEG